MTALALDGTSPLDLGAVTEVFGIDRGLAADWYDFSICGQRRGRLGTRGGLSLTVDRGLEELAVADTIVVLPVARFMGERPHNAVLAALAAASARGSPMVSLCLGAFVLAAAGLMEGRRATTHWPYCHALSDAYPQVEVVPDVLYIDEGDVLTSGGVAAAIDLCLHLVRKDHGAEIANRLGRGPYLTPAASGSAPPSAGRSNIARRTRPSTTSPTRRDGPPDLLQRAPGPHPHPATPLASRAAGAHRAPPPRN